MVMSMATRSGIALTSRTVIDARYVFLNGPGATFPGAATPSEPSTAPLPPRRPFVDGCAGGVYALASTIARTACVLLVDVAVEYPNHVAAPRARWPTTPPSASANAFESGTSFFATVHLAPVVEVATRRSPLGSVKIG